MVLTDEQIKSILLGEVDPWIEKAREDATQLEMHYYGTGLEDYLKKVEGLESDNQIELRKRFAISNKFLTENLLRPLDNIWKAKGGSEAVEIPTDKLKEEFIESLEDVKAGLSLDGYIQEIWKDRFITDPNGLIFLEVKKDGSEAYFTQKTIFDIRNMRVHGMDPEYVIFEPDVKIDDTEKKELKDKDEEVKFYWVVDDVKYYRVRVKGKEVTILKQPDSDDPQQGVTTENSFKEVPAILNSSIIDTKRKIKLSPIWKQVELLNAYVIDNSIKEIFKKKFGFPVFWMFSGKKTICNACEGTGQRIGDDEQSRGTCTSCGGTGELSVKRDVSDVHLVSPPQSKEDPVINTIAGFEQPPVDTWKMMNEELDRMWDLIFFSHWGTTTERHDNETATGRFIDVQPVHNRLDSYTDIAEAIHNKMARLWALFRIRATAESEKFKYSISYGRRFLIETPDQVWEKYIKAKEKKAPTTTLDLLLVQFFESEFQSNEMMQQYHLKLMKVEPFVHMSVGEVQALSIPDTDKAMKIYFSAWKNQQEIQEVIENPLEDLKTSLSEFVSEISLTKIEVE